MNAAVNQHHVEVLKRLLLSALDIENIQPADCRSISFAIIAKTELFVSETTIRRLFGFAVSRFAPSVYTLNAIAVYCGYQSWQAFAAEQDGDSTAVIPDIKWMPPSMAPPALTGPEMDFFTDPLLNGLLETAIPTLILKANAPYFTIVRYNAAYTEVTYTRQRDIAGLSFWEAFDPQKAGGYGPVLLHRSLNEVIETRKTVKMVPLHYNIPSAVHNIGALRWWDVRIMPVIYDDDVKYLIINVTNITDKILHQDAIEQAVMRELTLAEDLAASNVNLNLANTKLAESYEELSRTKQQLEELNRSLEERVLARTKLLLEGESKQRKLIDNAPVAIAVLKGPQHVVETANKKIINYWGKTDEVINKSLAVALPEIEDQPFIAILDKVRVTGIAYVNPELCAWLNIGGVMQPRYYDMIYQPIQNVSGITDSIFIVAFDITDHVLALKQLQQSESILRLAVSAANIGTWSFDPQERVIHSNAIFAKILGWEHARPMTYTEAVAQVTDNYRHRIMEIVEAAINDGGEYAFTYTQRRFNDNKGIRLKATGKITVDDSGGHQLFSGIIQQIGDGEPDDIQASKG